MNWRERATQVEIPTQGEESCNYHPYPEIGEIDANEHHLVDRAKQIRVGQQTVLHTIVEKLVVLLQNLVNVRHFLLLNGKNRVQLAHASLIGGSR